jgi:hypothetical protein
MEEWKQIAYSPNYQVSNLSNIRHVNKNKNMFINYERLKKTNTRARIYLPIDNKHKGYYLHRIVAEHFLENPNHLPEVNHKNGDFYDNRACNLEWISKNDNMNHAVDNKLMVRFTRRVRVLNKKTNQEQLFDSITECAKHLQCSKGTISQECKGKIKNKALRSIKEVIQYDLHGNVLCTFPSSQDASKTLNIDHSGIHQCCSYYRYNDTDRPKSYKLKCFKGFIFKFGENIERLHGGATVKELEISYVDIQQNDTNYEKKEEDILWKPYPELDKYLVSNTGEVKHKRTNRILQGSKVNGYRFVNLNRDDDTKRNCLIHRLVAETFLENPEKKPVVNHKDTNILNNHVSNLEWVTYKENMNTKETIDNLKKSKNSKHILHIDIEPGTILSKYYGATECEKMLKINAGTVLYICNYYNGKKCSNQQKTYKKTQLFIFEEDKDKLSDILKIAKTDYNQPRIMTVQLDKNTNEMINRFASGYEASKTLNIPYTGINQCCHYYNYSDTDRPECYKLKTYKGFIFKQIQCN